MAKVNIGDRVSVTTTGEVTWVSDNDDYFETREVGSNSVLVFESGIDRKVEVLEKPLTVGDEVTSENRHLLPEKFILADKDGDSWNEAPTSIDTQYYGPFKLVYIHDSNS